MNKIPLSFYWRLGRFDKPIGILLLWAPTAWALWLVNNYHPQWALLTLFLCGSIIMRAAGCVINDIVDASIDAHVPRTQTRVLACKQLSKQHALYFLMILLSIAFLLLLQLPVACQPYAIAALIITCIYPFGKRFIRAPQAILGIAFSMGVPMVYVASFHPFDHNMVILLLINCLWVLAYDTEYAITDREADIKLKLQSTAILMGEADRLIIGILLGSAHIGWLIIAYLNQWNYSYFIIGWLLGVGLILYQLHLIHERQPTACMRAFFSNSYYGLLMWLTLMISGR